MTRAAMYIDTDGLVLVPDDMADTVRRALAERPEPPIGRKLLPLYLSSDQRISRAMQAVQEIKDKFGDTPMVGLLAQQAIEALSEPSNV